MEISSSAIFYQLSNDANAEMKRIAKSDVLIIKKADGTKIDPNVTEFQSTPAANAKTSSDNSLCKSVLQHTPVTATATSLVTTDKKGNKIFSAKIPDGHELNYQILSEVENTVAVIKGKYMEEEYIIPDSVTINGITFIVTEIGDAAFLINRHDNIKNVIFPLTLKKRPIAQIAGCDPSPTPIATGVLRDSNVSEHKSTLKNAQ